MQQEPKADNNEEEPTDTEENENADHKDNGKKNNGQNEHGYALRPRRNIQMHAKYRDYHTESQKEGMLTYTYDKCMESEDSEKWKKAIKEEKHSLYENKSWIYVNREKATGKKILTSKWFFKIKDDGRHKARLVVRGCQQKEGEIDFKDTFSRVVDMHSLRVLFAIAARKNMNMQTFDVKTAFLYGDLEEENYMEIPEGYKNTGKVCLLKKALYGLRQAPSKWNKKLTTFLKEEGLNQLKSDQCIFKNDADSVFMAIHVDDGKINSR
ncbi:hypothetical protein B7P43_G12889 [Cryptotermes secundus]|nr:hypothetical protein B7P43_G12889 [Cryptotermes secundus]